MIARLRQFRDDCSGSAIIEFAILAPTILTLLIGVVQVGLWMQTYNALRSVAADSGRFVAVEYQKPDNRISNADMALWAKNKAISDYLFDSTQLTTSVVDAGTQSIGGITEKTITISYTMDSYLGIVGIDAIPVTFSRPIFVSSS